MLACLNDENVGFCRDLIRYGADTSKAHLALMHICSEFGDPEPEERFYTNLAHYREMLELLLELGVDVDSKDEEGLTPLAYVATKKIPRPGIVDLLLKHGADPNAVGNDGRTVLMRVTRQNNPCRDVVSLLQDHGGDANAKDAQGRTALFYACQRWTPAPHKRPRLT